MRLSVVRHAGLLLGTALLCACASQPQRTGVNSSFAPAMTIERFLSATNQNDYDTMAALFGTRDGSVTRTWSKKEVDDRMVLFASVLRHTDYAIASEQIVPGRRDEATQLNVQMVISGQTVEVPFTLVRTANQNWLIEEIRIDHATRATGNRNSGQ